MPPPPPPPPPPPGSLHALAAHTCVCVCVCVCACLRRVRACVRTCLKLPPSILWSPSDVLCASRRTWLWRLQAQAERNRANLQKMMQANEALQKQLQDLNGVVEHVVQKALGNGGGGPHGSRSAAKLPSGAFPSQAKPGMRGQRGQQQQPAPSTRLARQPPPGLKPFK